MVIDDAPTFNLKHTSAPNDAPTPANPSRRPKIGLALSGAVMRGPVHIGVLRALAAAHIPIDAVAGASAGALVGAIYCAGFSVDDITHIAPSIHWRAIARPVFPRRGFLSFARMETWLISLLGDLRFSDLQYPFAVVATDLERGEPVTFTDGRIAPAVHSSSAVPGFVVPVAYRGHILGDGGVSYNLPVAAARALGAEVVIGVDLFVPTIHRPLGPFQFGLSALETMVRRSGGGVDQADILISPPELAGVSYFRTGAKQAARLIALGELAAARALPAIQSALAHR